MQRLFFQTFRAIVPLAILSWAGLASAQLGQTLAQPQWIFEARRQATEPVSVQSQSARAAEQRMRAILAQPYAGKPGKVLLTEFLSDLRRTTGLPIQLDLRALEDASIGADLSVDTELPPVSLGSALSLILQPVELVWTIHDERLLVTTPVVGHEPVAVKVYPVRDLLSESIPSNAWMGGSGALIGLIQHAIQEKSWDERGGNGSIQYFAPAGSLVISQTFANHEGIAIFLAKLRKGRDVQNIPTGIRHRRRHGSRHHRDSEPTESTDESFAPITVQSAAEQAAEDRIRAALEKPLSEKIDRAPLAEALAKLERETGLPIRIDTRSLEDASVPLDAPVSCDLTELSLHAAFGVMLGQLDLTWTIDHECLRVATPAIVNERVVVRVYPVRDLVACSDPYDPRHADFSSLNNLITDTIAPTMWSEGNNSANDFFPASGSLVIPQTREVHEQIEQLLAALRQARDDQRIVLRPAHHRRHPSDPVRFGQSPDALPPPASGGMGGGMGGGMF